MTDNMESIKIKPFSNSEILTCNALGKLLSESEKLDPQTFRLLNAVVWNVIDQLENTPQLKKYNIKIND
jgi:hypothetical protein